MTGPAQLRQYVYPSTEWFNIPITRDTVVAPTPGVLDADTASRQGRIGIPNRMRISAVHFHYDHPAGTGQYVLELWRMRNQVPLLIASCTSNGAAGDFGQTNFVFVDNDYRNLEGWDYLLLQATAVMTGAGSKNAAGFVDIHFDPIPVSQW